MMHFSKKHRILCMILVLFFGTTSCSLLDLFRAEPDSRDALEEGQFQEKTSQDTEDSEFVEGGEKDAEETESGGDGTDQSPSSEVGLTRANPIPLGTMISIPDWDIQVLELLRGEEAAALVNSGSRKFDPPPEGYEYALAKVFLRCTSMDEEAHSLDTFDMFLTGSSHARFGDLIDGWPAPEFLFEDMFTAEAVEGWIDTLVPVTETDLLVVLDFRRADPRFTRFFELEEGASVIVERAQFEPALNEVGGSVENPASIGEKIIMQDWEITVLSSIRGEEALIRLSQDDEDYKGPDEGDEYVLMEVFIRYTGAEDVLQKVDSTSFRVEVADYERGRIRKPDPSEFSWIDAYILPGAALEGWVIVPVPEGLANPVIEIDPGDGEYYATESIDTLRYITVP